MNIEKLVKLAFENVHESIYYKIQSAVSNEKNYYGYIPSNVTPIVYLIKEILKIKNYKNKKFIDIGCGYPLIPKLMEILELKNPKGLEIQDIYINIQKYKGDDFLIKGDLLTYNFENYDILYAYNPIRDNKLMNEGLKNIKATMKKGAIFYFLDASYGGLSELNSDFEFTNKASLFVYKKN